MLSSAHNPPSPPKSCTRGDVTATGGAAQHDYGDRGGGCGGGVEVYMRETCGTGRRVPRCVFVDIGCGPGDVVDGVENLVDPSNVICSPQGCGSNWAVGHYVTGAEMLDEVMDSIRLECERCDCMDGFQLAHSLSGGTGSGLGTLILGALREEYPDRMFCTFSVFPSPVPDVPLAPYNSILSMFRLDEDSDLTFCLDNDSLLKISAPTLKHPPTYKDLNHLI